MKPNYKLQTTNYKSGFTLIEIFIVVSITAVLTSIVAVNFQTLRAIQEIRAARHDFISKIREIQGHTLAGKNVPGQTLAANAYIITLTAGSPTYRVDYDIGGVVSLLENMRLSEFGGGVTISSMMLVPAGTSVNPVTVRISAPYGTIEIDGAANRVLQAELQHKNGLSKRVHIDGISGRVTQAP